MTKLCIDCKFMGPLSRCRVHDKYEPDLVNGGFKRSTGFVHRCVEQRESKYWTDCGPSGKLWAPK